MNKTGFIYQGPAWTLIDKITVILSKTNKTKKTRGEKMSIYKVNDLFYDCEYQNTRSGFNHIVKVKNKFGEVLAVKKTHYINRTWESYNYQTAMMRAQDELKKQIKAAKAGRVFLNYRYEDWTEYNFDVQPKPAVLS